MWQEREHRIMTGYTDFPLLLLLFSSLQTLAATLIQQSIKCHWRLADNAPDFYGSQSQKTRQTVPLKGKKKKRKKKEKVAGFRGRGERERSGASGCYNEGLLAGGGRAC